MSVVTAIADLPYLDVPSRYSGPKSCEGARFVTQKRPGGDMINVGAPVSEVTEEAVGRLPSLLDALTRRGRRHGQPHHVCPVGRQVIGDLVQTYRIGSRVSHDLAEVPTAEHHHHHSGVVGQHISQIIVDPWT